MAEIIWSDPALEQLDDIAEYIALDKPEAASGLVKKVFSTVDRLEQFPESGHVPPEAPNSIYREVHVQPCRIFYRPEGDAVLIVHVMREERQLRRFLLDADLDN
ncbi:type II toxin-antitoxin system RelE/ParE family toxin [Marinimicrobium sp. ABcell2]|uniref:type II toxin-antitoxin system RelE/ParE family toxin n=1 Tax=Marinimicrobium sp. ABcell2 TaxID=3069751 RepID=UPI0027B516AA|nr:type II toxin-antitoxin system RelE/ParE family toxin [Marinimicrobium sp. ABcell2]MDQ2077759.1 type II toxin-antitoxin system RelE/ParE family toxin [Marinimicrobium sp. ABcell2]